MVRSFCEALEGRRLFTAYVVNTLTDTVDEQNGISDGLLSFREALIAANTNAAFGDAAAGSTGRDTIRFAPNLLRQTFRPELANFVITSDVLIDGGGLTIDASLAGPIFNGSSGEFTLRNFTIAGGTASTIDLLGGGEIENVIFRDNESSQGAAIRVGGLGTLTIRNSQFINNHATILLPEGGGGAIYYGTGGGTLNIFNSIFRGNTADGYGGALAADSDSTVNLHNTTFSNNRALAQGGAGGAIYNVGGVFTIRGSTFSGNSVAAVSGLTRSAGGALFNDGGTVRIFNSRFTRNVAEFTDGADASDGGAIKSTGGSVEIRDSQIDRNRAAAGGGIDVDAGSLSLLRVRMNYNNAWYGGALQDGFAASVSIRQSVIANNTALNIGGGLYLSGNFQMGASQIVGNVSTTDNAGVGGIFIGGGTSHIERSLIAGNRGVQGGGIDNNSNTAVLNLLNCQVVNNRASIGAGMVNGLGTATVNRTIFAGNRADLGGAIDVGSGGGIYNAATLTLIDSHIVGNTASTTGGGLFSTVSVSLVLDDTRITGNTPNNQVIEGTVVS